MLRAVSFHLALAFLATHASYVTAVPSDTGSLISDALAELPNGMGGDIVNLMTSMNMTEENTHFSRLVATDDDESSGSYDVNQSFVLMTFPTPANDFEMRFIKLTSDLDPDETHVVLVCGHTAPSKCGKATEHAGAPDDHPCGPTDALEISTGPFCEAISLEHESTEHGELLLHGAFVVESVANAYGNSLDGSSSIPYETPTIHLEIVDTKSFQAMIADDVDADDEAIKSALESGDLQELEEALSMRVNDAIAPAASPAAAPTQIIGIESTDEDDSEDLPTKRRLLRIGGISGGIRGGGMRRGIGGTGARFGAAAGLGRGAGYRGRNMAVNQVMASSFYGNKGRGAKGQAAYFNDPGIPGGK